MINPYQIMRNALEYERLRQKTLNPQPSEEFQAFSRQHEKIALQIIDQLERQEQEERNAAAIADAMEDYEINIESEVKVK